MAYSPMMRELVALANSDQVWAVVHVDYESKMADLVTVTGPPRNVAVSFGCLIPTKESFVEPSEELAA